MQIAEYSILGALTRRGITRNYSIGHCTMYLYPGEAFYEYKKMGQLTPRDKKIFNPLVSTDEITGGRKSRWTVPLKGQ